MLDPKTHVHFFGMHTSTEASLPSDLAAQGELDAGLELNLT